MCTTAKVLNYVFLTIKRFNHKTKRTKFVTVYHHQASTSSCISTEWAQSVLVVKCKVLQNTVKAKKTWVMTLSLSMMKFQRTSEKLQMRSQKLNHRMMMN